MCPPTFSICCYHSWTNWNKVCQVDYVHLLTLTFSYLFLLLSSFGMVWFRGGWGELWHWRWTFDLHIDLMKLWGGWVEPWDLLLPSTFFSSNLLPPPSIPPSYSSQTSTYLLLPPPEGSQMTNEFIHEEISMLFCSEKLYGGGGWHCNYSYKLQVQVSYRFEIDLVDM